MLPLTPDSPKPETPASVSMRMSVWATPETGRGPESTQAPFEDQVDELQALQGRFLPEEHDVFTPFDHASPVIPTASASEAASRRRGSSRKTHDNFTATVK